MLETMDVKRAPHVRRDGEPVKLKHRRDYERLSDAPNFIGAQRHGRLLAL